jgi:hypothetical protein
MFIYDIENQSWSIAIMDGTCLSPGGYILQASRTWDEQSDSWDATSERWNDVTLLQGAVSNLCGTSNGKVYTMWNTRQDKGVDFTGKFVTKPITYGNLPTYCRTTKLQLYFKNEYASNMVTVSVKRDYSDVYETIGTCTLTGTGNELTFILPCNISARTLTMKLESSSRYRFIGAIFHYEPQGDR